MSLSMLSQFRGWLAPPKFSDQKKTERADLQNIVFLGTIAIAVIFGLVTLVLEPDPWPRLLLTSLWIVAAGGSFFLMRRGYVNQAGLLFSVSAWLMLTLEAWLAGTVMSAGFTNYTVIILVIGMLCGLRVALIFAGLSALSGLGLLFIEANDLSPAPLISTSPASIWTALGTNFVAVAVLLHLANRSISNALEQAQVQKAALSSSNRDLEAAQTALKERSSELATAVEILENQLTERKQMADSLQQSEEELQQLNTELEQRVQERAGELAEANEALIQEIATRKQAEIALKETFEMIERAKQEWEATVDALPQLVCLIDRKGRIKRANRTVERWGLAPVTEASDRGLLELFHLDGCHPDCELKNYWDQATESLVRGQPTEFEMEDENLERYLHYQAQPILIIPEGPYQPSDTLGVIVVQDITERKETEESLRDSEERYRSLFEDSPISIWEEDFSEVKQYCDRLRTEGVQDFRAFFTAHPEAVIDCVNKVKVVDVNQATLSLYRAKDKKELLGTLNEVFDENSWDLVKEEFIALAAGETTRYSGETIAKTLTGNHRHIDLTLAVAPGYEETWSKVLVSIVDITDRKRAELALQESQQRLGLAVSGTGGALWDEELDPEATFDELTGTVYLSPEEKRLLGYDGDEGKALPNVVTAWDRHVLPEDRAQREQNQRDHFEGRTEVLDHEYRIRRKDGAIRWIQARSRIIRDEQGRPIRWIGIDWDVTKRKQAEEDLRKLSSAVEQSPSTVMITDLEGRIEFVNPRFSQVTGYVKEEALGQNPSVFRSGQHPPEFYQELWQTILAGQVWRGEIINRTKAGELYWDLASIAPIRDQAGEITHFVKVSEDITERKGAEAELARYRDHLEELVSQRTVELRQSNLKLQQEMARHQKTAVALQQSEENFRSLADNAQDGFIIIAEDEKFVYANRRAGEMTGYNPAELHQLSIKDIIHPEQYELLRDRYRRRIAGEEVVSQYETSLIHKNGQPIPVEVTAAKTVWHGQPADVVSFRDITERLKAAEILKQERDFAQTLVDTAQAIILVLDPQGRIDLFNPYLEQISGYSLEEVRGQCWISTFVPVREQEHIRGLLNQAIDDTQTQGNVNAIVTRDGRERQIEWYDKTLKDGQGGTLGLLAVGQDITERLAMAETVRRAEARYRALFEQAPAMYVVTRHEGDQPIIADCNNMFLSALNYSRDEVIGRSLAEFYAPESRTSLLDGGYERALTGTFTAEERQLVTADGRVIDTLLQAEPELDAEGTVSGTRATFVDITDRKQAETELTQRNQELQTLQAASAAISSTLDLDFVLNTLTREMANLLGVESCDFSEWDQNSDTVYQIAGYPPDGWPGDRPEPELYHLVDFPVTQQVLMDHQPVQMTLSQPDIDPAERAYMEQAKLKALMMLPMIYQDRAIGLVEVGAIRLERNFTEHQIALAQTLADQAAVAMQNARLYEQAREEIAERRRAEQELRYSEERFRRVITSISDHIYVTEVAPSGEHLNLYISPNVETLTGYPPEQFLTNWDLWGNEIIYPADRTAAATQLAALDQGRSSEAEYRLIRRGGDVIWVRDSARVENQDNSRIIYGVINDITARKETEEALVRYSERLEILRQIEQGILSAHSMDEIGQATMNRIRRLIPCFSAAVTIFDYMANEAIVITSSTDRAGQSTDNIRTNLIQTGQPEDRFNILKQGQIVMLEEADLKRDYGDVRDRSIRSVMVVPLLHQAELIGSLNLSATEAGTFTPEHREIVQQVADQLAIAIRQADLYAQTQQHAAELERRVVDRTRELSALYEVTAVASELLTLETMLERCLTQILGALEGNAGLIFLRNDPDQTFTLTTQQSIPPQLVPQVEALLRDHGILAGVADTGGPMIIPNLGDQPGFPPELASNSMASYAGAPIRAAGDIIGILNILGQSTRRYNIEELALLASVADQIGVAVENVRLRMQAEEAAVLEERERLARELHDSVTQSLYSLTLFTEGSLELAKNGEIELVKHNLTRIGETAQQALKEMRLMVYELRPLDLEREGLVGALHQRLATVEKRAGVNARLVAEELIQLPPAVEKELYRITQEALNNILKHAEATFVTVYLRVVEEHLELEIVDNGQGFDLEKADKTGGLGLRSMRERIDKLGGSLNIHSAPNKGTIVHVQVKIE